MRCTITLDDSTTKRLEVLARVDETASATMSRVINAEWIRREDGRARVRTIEEARAEYHRIQGRWPEGS